MKRNLATAASALLGLMLWGTALGGQNSPPASAAGTAGAAASASGSATQPTAAPAGQSSEQNVPEISTSDKNAAGTPGEQPAATFKVKVNLVEVRVVVRDAQGHAVGNLKQEDFQLFDNGKPQVISKFSMEQLAGKPAVEVHATPEVPGETPAAKVLNAMPERYVAYLFDDIHLKSGDLAQIRTATEHNLETLQPTDRAAIFTTSGQNQLDFTDDRAKLREALNRLTPRPLTATGLTECPDISYYMADQIWNKNDGQALQVATQDAWDCAYDDDPHKYAAAQQLARSVAEQRLHEGDHETQVTIASLTNVVRRVAGMPGQRSIIMISPGFYNPDQLQEQSDIADRALHSGVIINAIDARGLYTVGTDVSKTRNPSPSIAGRALQYEQQAALADEDVLSELANATGGTFVHNTNDMGAGLRRLATLPEYSYMLGFTPQNLKLDGSYHKLKVTLKGEKLNIQARKGYYAPKHAVNATEEARREVDDEVFSREEIHDIPAEVHTQYFKTGDDAAKMSVVIRLDVRHLHYHKADGRNNDSLTVVSALFDRNGNFVTGQQQTLTMRLKDDTLENKLAHGITLKSSFDVKPGSYVVRLVVRDEEGQLAAQNTAVEIP